MKPVHPASIVALLLPLTAVVALAWALTGGAHQLRQSIDPRQIDYVGSASCTSCHDDRHDSWYRTFHRTMTQQAGPSSIQGRFDGRNLDFQGIRVRPMQLDGRYYFDYQDLETGRQLNRIEIHRTVGSNRYQQYLTRIDDDGTYVRLHYLWHNGDQRWVHMNAAFLGADDRPYDQNVAIWNQSCIFCHNTGIEPRILNDQELRTRARAGEPVNMTTEPRFASVVAELGISCESCHGPGAEHVARAKSFWPRQVLRLAPGLDQSIVNPVRHQDGRGSQICAQCHAQRVPSDPNRILEWMHDGPSYRPGNDLHAHVTPVTRDLRAPIEGLEDLFVNRFWADGTPRLTAYEYQGMTMSAGHADSDLSCMDCHTMHTGDPRGQMTDRQRSNAPCLRCHTDYQGDKALTEHTLHPAASDASNCYSCHMPEIVYGVMDIHRSHRIESPNAQRDAASGRPNACLNCHLDQSPGWAAEQLESGWNNATSGGIERLDGLSPQLAEVAAMLAGDPVQKAVTAYRIGQTDHVGEGLDRAWAVPFLLQAMRDHYPSSRRFARASLIAILEGWPDREQAEALIEPIRRFDFTAPIDARSALLDEADAAWRGFDRNAWPPVPSASGLTPEYTLPPNLIAELRRLGARQDKQINIGE